MVDRPSALPRWATSNVISPDTGVPNVVEPPESKKNAGWNYSEMPARNFINWLHRSTYDWLNYLDDKVSKRNTVSDGDGTELFTLDNSLITLYAVDKETPANYLHAMGFRGTGTPVLTVLSSNVLTLGTAAADGSQAISGGVSTDIITYGISQK